MEQSQIRLPTEVAAHLRAAVRRDEFVAVKSRQLGRRVVDLSEIGAPPSTPALVEVSSGDGTKGSDKTQ